MKLNFNNGNNEKNNRTEVEVGSYEDMIKSRKRRMPEMEANIQELFENWSGETVVILKAEVDENGYPKGCHQLIVGVDRPQVIMKLIHQLDDTQEALMNSLIAGGDPRVLASMALDMLKDIFKEDSNGKKN